MRYAGLIAILFGWPHVAQCQNGKSSTPTNQTTGNEEPVPPTHVIIEEPVPTIHAEVKTSDQKQETKDESWKRFFTPEWVIVYVTAGYALIAWWTLSSIKRQAALMERQLVVPYRAYLVASGDPFPTPGGIAIEIKNMGQVAARVRSATVELSILDKNGARLFSGCRSKAGDHIVPHGDASAFAVQLGFPLATTADMIIQINGELVYEIGFNKLKRFGKEKPYTDMLKFTRVGSGFGSWEKAGSSIRIQFQ
jgi:hypothetical protein